MTQPQPLEDLTKDELHSRFGVSMSLNKSEMIAEIQSAQTVDPSTGQPLGDPTDPAVQRAQEYRTT